MATTTLTLTDFLLARIAEDKAAANAAADRPWVNVVTTVSAGDGWRVADEYGEHAQRHNPARVLAECDAKRRIVAAHETNCGGYHDWPPTSEVGPGREPRLGLDAGLWHAVRLLALPYADHPDYDPAWRA